MSEKKLTTRRVKSRSTAPISVRFSLGLRSWGAETPSKLMLVLVQPKPFDLGFDVLPFGHELFDPRGQRNVLDLQGV